MKPLKIFLYTFLTLFLIFFITRLITDKQLDDVTIGIQCDQELLEKADILYITPFFNNTKISSDNEWCNEILNLNKELALHGVFHTYQEFQEPRDKEYLQEGIQIFQDCLNEEPTRFKAPNLAWTKENNWIKEDFEVDLKWNQIFHKTSHCNDTGRFPNWLINLI